MGAMQQWDVERWGSAHLGDDGEVLAQVVEANCCYVHFIDDDLPSSCLQHPEQAVGEGGFSSPGPAHNPDLWKQLFRLADRAVENRAYALHLGLVGLPALTITQTVCFGSFSAAQALRSHMPSPSHPSARTEAKKKEQL